MSTFRWLLDSIFKQTRCIHTLRGSVSLVLVVLCNKCTLGDHIVYNASSRAGLTQRRAAVRWTANTRNPCPHADDAMVSVICWRSWAEPRRTGNELYAEMRAKMLNRRLSIISTKHTGDLKRKKQPRKHDQLSYQHQARKRWEIRFFHRGEKLGQYVATNDMVTSPVAMVDIRTTVVNRPLLKGR